MKHSHHLLVAISAAGLWLASSSLGAVNAPIGGAPVGGGGGGGGPVMGTGPGGPIQYPAGRPITSSPRTNSGSMNSVRPIRGTSGSIDGSPASNNPDMTHGVPLLPPSTFYRVDDPRLSSLRSRDAGSSGAVPGRGKVVDTPIRQRPLPSLNSTPLPVVVLPWWWDLQSCWWGGSTFGNGFVNNGGGGILGPNGNTGNAPADANDNSQVAVMSPLDKMDAALAAMNQIQDQLKAQFESSPQYITAMADLKKSQFTYDMAAADARDAVESNPRYKDALAARDAAQDKVDTMNMPHHIVPLQEAEDAATQKMKASTNLDHVREDLETNDPKVVAARDHLNAAKAQVNSLWAGFDASVKDDLAWQTARHHYDSARAQASNE